MSDAAGLTTYELTSSSQPCAGGEATDEVEEYAVGQSGLQNLGGGEYQINWKTRSLA